MSLDFNDAPEQRGFGDLIPANTFVKLQFAVRPGDAGPEGMLKASQTSDALFVDAEFTVFEGEYDGRKLWSNLTVSGGKLDDSGRSKGGEITRSFLRAVIESARGIDPKDMSERGMAARRIAGYSEFDGMIFAAKIGIEKDKTGQYPDKNKILAVVTPDKKEYQAIMDGTYQNAKPVASQQAAAPWAQQKAPATTHDNTKPAWASGSAPQQQAPANPTKPAWAA